MATEGNSAGDSDGSMNNATSAAASATAGSGQDRAISLREAALLQTFPRDYQFFAPDECRTISTTARSTGNAVPVALAHAVARSVARTLDGKHDG